MARKAIIFDLDGTIWKGYDWYSSVLARWAGVKQSVILSNIQSGKSIIEVSNRLGISRQRLIQLLTDSVAELQLYPKVPETLRELHRRSTGLGIVTDLVGRIVDLALTNHELKPFFKVIVHPGNCRARKPSPVPLQRAMKSLSRQGYETFLYVGDRQKDAETALAAGVPFVWASFGYSPRKPNGSVKVIKDFSEVLRL